MPSTLLCDKVCCRIFLVGVLKWLADEFEHWDGLLQVAQIRAENSSLLRRLADVNEKFNDVAFDNRVLKSDVETLR